ncbi:MAG: PilZ domain-containing protein [Candidatus Omnitrophota bacterium]|nr:PilZ domain-containing protein [Candidatus Omnitrophota bacterium]
MHNHQPERRECPRIDKGLPLKISCGDFDIATETKNISAVGAYCSVDRYIAPMTKLNILLLLPFTKERKSVNKKVSCKGVIVRAEDPARSSDRYHIAIYFSDISKKDKKTLTDFLNLSPTR